MLHQFIYTRCYPHHDIHEQDRVIPQDGFGLFSLDEAWYGDTNARDAAFLELRLPVKNASSEGTARGLFPSFEYTRLPSGRAVLMNEVARPLCQTPRENGLSHRSGNYVKQALVGEPQGYPYEWLGASVWTAHKTHENDYYRDNQGGTAAPFLSMAEDEPENGNITLDTVRGFVRDGRGDAMRAALAFVLEQLQKPESERRPLLIKDTPDNVALWAAAVQAALPRDLAWEVTFATNRADPGPQLSNTLFYYTDANGNIAYMMNRSVEQTRHPYCLIVGFHPKDQAQLRSMSPDYALLDGTAKAAQFEVTGTDRAYFTAALNYDDDGQDFCRVVWPGLVDPDVTRLPDLYDAYTYLLDADHPADRWEYTAAAAHLDTLGMPQNPALTDYLLRQCAGAYGRMMEEDLRRGLPMLSHLCAFADALDRRDEVVAVLMDRLQSLMEDIASSGSALEAVWQVLQRPAFAAVSEQVLSDLFNDTELEFYAGQVMKATPATADTVLRMFVGAMEQSGVSWRDLPDEETKRAFVCVCLTAMASDATLAGGWLDRLRPFPELFGQVITTVSALLGGRASRWWDTVLARASARAVVRAVRLCDLDQKTQTDIFELLDGRLCDQVTDDDLPADEMTAWGGSLQLLSASAILWEFRRDFLASRKELLATEALKRLIAYQLPWQKAFLQAEYLDPIVEKAVELRSGFVHLCLLTPFVFEDEGTRDQYLNAYLSRVLVADKSRYHMESLIALADGLAVPVTVNGRTATQLETIKEAAEAALITQVAAVYKNGMVDYVAKARIDDNAIETWLTHLLTEASQKVTPKKSEGFFGWFGRRK